MQPYGAFQPCHNSENALQPCLSEAASEQTAFSRDLETGTYTPLVTGCPKEGPCAQAIREHANVPDGTVFGQRAGEYNEPCPPTKFCGPFFLGASPNGEHVIVQSRQGQLTKTPAPAGSLYEWSAGKPASEQLQLVSILPQTPEQREKGEELAANEGLLGAGENEDARGAVSNDGSRVFWTTSESGVVYMRDLAKGEKGETLQIGGATASFEDASADGDRVFYTENQATCSCAKSGKTVKGIWRATRAI